MLYVFQHKIFIYNRFTYAIVKTNVYSLYTSRSSVAEGGEGEKENLLYTSYPTSAHNLRNFFRKLFIVYVVSTPTQTREKSVEN